MNPLRSIRLAPNSADFLDQRRFDNGDLYYDATQKTLVLYDGVTKGGIPLLRADLSNAQSGLGVAVATTPPADSRSGSLWFDTNTGVLYVYVDDGDGNQWVQPAMPQFGQSGGGAGGGGGATTITQLTDVSVINPSVGQVLKWNGAFWANSADLQGTASTTDTSLTPKVTLTVTIVGPQSPDTGNKYRINGEYRPTLVLQRGYTYVFDQSDDTNVYWPNPNGGTPNPHNLNFSADNPNGERDGGTTFLTNVVYKLDNVVVTRQVYNSSSFNGATSRTVEITVGNNFPTTLYYWCYNHRNMGRDITFANPKLIGLSDVAISGVSTGEVLKYDGTQWVNAPDLSGSSASDSFRTIAIAGQANVVADSPTDTLNLVAGSNITLTTNSTTDTITIAAIAPTPTTYTFNTQTSPGGVKVRLAGSDNTTQDVLFEEGANVSLTRVDANTISISASLSGAGVATSFSTIAISGQPNVIAESSADTLTLVAGTNISLIADGTTDTITINNTQTVTQQNTFANIVVQAQPTITADIPADNLTLVGAGGIAITTNATTDTITFTGPTVPAALDDLTDVQISVTPTDGQVLKYSSALAAWVPGTDNAGAGGAASNSFETISVAGQSNVVADGTTDTLTLVGAGGLTITTNATTDTITFTSPTVPSTINDLTDVTIGGVGNNLSLGQVLYYDGVDWKNYPTFTMDRLVLSASTALDVVNNSLLSYRFTNFTGNSDNPTLYFKAGQTIAFNLNTLQGTHPFAILDQAGANYDTGLVHISRDGIVSTGASAQGKISGTLYWQIPRDTVGRYQYICTLHAAMVGNIYIEPANEIDTSGTTTIDCRTARAFYFSLSGATTLTITNVIPGVETKLYVAAAGAGGGTTNFTIQGGTNATMTPSTSQTFTISNQFTKHYSIMGIGGNGFVVGY